MKRPTTFFVGIWVSALTIVASVYVNATVKRPDPVIKTHVDTVRITTTVYDTVISRARDTIRIQTYNGVVTEAALVRILCQHGYSYDNDKDNHFIHSPIGIVFCPKSRENDSE